MATWKPLTVKSVVQDINDGSYVLPVIQRWLVWNETKMELLFDSLLKGNSFGGIMILEEDSGSPPLFAFRRFSQFGEEHHSHVAERINSTKFLVIDGQQRLQTFYMGLSGGINGKELYFNLNSTRSDYEFRFTSNAKTLPQFEANHEDEPVEKLWYKVSDLYERLRKVGDAYLVADEILRQQNIEDNELMGQVRNNVLKFYISIFANDTVGISTVTVNHDPAVIDEEKQRVVELFRRLNDGGTRLSSLDLLAAMFKGFDYRMEEFFREVGQFENIGISQDEVIKLVFLLQDNHARELTQIRKEDTEFALQNQARIVKSLEGVRQFLKNAQLYDYYNAGGRSDIPLYFLAYHLFFKEVPTYQLVSFYDNYDAGNPDYLNVQRWLLLSLLNGVFSRGCGWIPYITGIRKILQVMKQFKGKLFPVQELFEVYRKHPLRFSEQIDKQTLDSWDRDVVLYLVYLGQNMTGRDIDHIHPRSKLEASYTTEEIHSVGNFQLLDVGTNRNEKRAKFLADWLKIGVADRDAYMNRHLIPKDNSLHGIESFRDFLAERKQLIVEKIDSYIPAAPLGSVMPVQMSESKPQPLAADTILDTGKLVEKVPDAYRDHPILQDKRRWGDIYKEMKLGRRWAGSYRKELAQYGIVTVADMALAIINLQLEFVQDVGYANIYRFHKRSDGKWIELDTSKFGGWGWKVTLEELERHDFNWKVFMVK